MGVFVSLSEILAFGVSKNTILKGCNRYRQGNTNHWANRKNHMDKRSVIIDIDTIPLSIKEKYCIPNGKEYLKNKAEKQQIKKFQEKTAQEELQNIQNINLLLNAYNNKWVKYYSYYFDLFKIHNIKSNETEIKFYAKNLAYWLELVELTGGTKTIRGSVKKVFNYHLKTIDILEISHPFKSYQKFSKKLKEFKENINNRLKITWLLLHKNIGNTNNRTTNNFHIGIAFETLSHPKSYTYPVVTQIINHHAEQEGQKLISESWVKNLMNKDPKFRNLVYARRKGEKYLNDNILPYQVRNISTYPGNVWMIDGSPLQFYCVAKDGRLRRLNLFIVLDVCTRKIVGFDISFTENKDNVKRALKSAILLEGHLPAEIVSDNFSANRTEEIKELQKILQYSGCQWRHARVGNARDKSYVERFFGVFQLSECALYHDYLGEGITAKRDIARPSKEYLIKNAKKQGYISETEMKQRVTQMVLSYNKTARKGIGNPVECYKNLPKPNVVQVDEILTAKLFWNTTKNTIRNAMVQFVYKGVKQHYEIYSHEHKLTLNFQEVVVRFDPQNLDTILIFNPKTDNFITKCKPVLKTHIGSVEATEETQLNMYKNEAKKESYKTYIEQQIELYRTKALEAIDKDYLEIIDPLELKKQTLNNLEDQMYLQYYYGQFGLDPQSLNLTKTKPIGVIKKAEILTPEQILISNINPQITNYKSIE